MWFLQSTRDSRCNPWWHRLVVYLLGCVRKFLKIFGTRCGSNFSWKSKPICCNSRGDARTLLLALRADRRSRPCSLISNGRWFRRGTRYLLPKGLASGLSSSSRTRLCGCIRTNLACVPIHNQLDQTNIGQQTVCAHLKVDLPRVLASFEGTT